MPKIVKLSAISRECGEWGNWANVIYYRQLRSFYSVSTIGRVAEKQRFGAFRPGFGKNPDGESKFKLISDNEIRNIIRLYDPRA